MTGFAKGGALKATPLMMVFLAMLLAPAPGAEATVIKEIRFGDNNAYVRMVIELDRPLDPPPSVSINRSTLRVALPGVASSLSDRQTGEYHSDIVSLDVSHSSDATRIDAVFSFAPADVKTFPLTDPHRFIIDIYRSRSPAAASPPVDNTGQTAVIEETEPLPEPYRAPEKPLPVDASPPIDEASTPVLVPASPPIGNAEDFRRNRFQQRLIAALIVVTSIIVVLLFFLIWRGSRQERPREPSWINDLPPTTDREIASIDAAIGKHLKNHDHR